MDRFKSVQIIIQSKGKIWRYSLYGALSDDLKERIEELLKHPNLKAIGPFTIKNSDNKIIGGVVK